MTLYPFLSPLSPSDDVPTGVAKVMASPVSVEWEVLFLMLAGLFGSIGSLVGAAVIA